MRLYLSDLHLEAPDTPTFQTFAALMREASGEAAVIHLLGDITEVWVGDDDDGPLALALKTYFQKIADPADNPI